MWHMWSLSHETWSQDRFWDQNVRFVEYCFNANGKKQEGVYPKLNCLPMPHQGLKVSNIKILIKVGRGGEGGGQMPWVVFLTLPIHILPRLHIHTYYLWRSLDGIKLKKSLLKRKGDHPPTIHPKGGFDRQRGRIRTNFCPFFVEGGGWLGSAFFM